MKAEYLKKLKELKLLLQQEIRCDDILSSFLNDKISKIPREVLNIFKWADKINKDFDFVFLGYDALSEEQIIWQYQNKNEFQSFFYRYEYIDDFKIIDDNGIRLWDELYSDTDRVININDISAWIPLFEFQGDYIIVDLNTNHDGVLIIVVDGYIASHLAPSVIEHIDDLIEGLESDIYTIDRYGIVFPTTWYLRKRMRAGEPIEPRFLS